MKIGGVYKVGKVYTERHGSLDALRSDGSLRNCYSLEAPFFL